MVVVSSSSEASPKLKLIDFDTVEPYSAKQARKSKSVIGTDQYIAQEAYGGKYSPASDMFAVGVMAYRTRAAPAPFAAGSPADFANMVERMFTRAWRRGVGRAFAAKRVGPSPKICTDGQSVGA